MAEPLLRLQRDHRNAAHLLDLLENHRPLFGRGQPAAVERVADAMRYMTDYPDRFHHPREDLVLERMADRDPRARPMLDDLRADHVLIERAGAELLEALVSRAGEPDAGEAIGTRIDEYVALMRYHMSKEETLFFPRASERLTREDWAEIVRDSTERADPLFGNRAEKHFEDLRRFIELRSPWASAGENVGPGR